jgi:hypothetical protein
LICIQYNIVNKKPDKLPRRHDIHGDVRSVLSRALSKSPDDRYATVGEFIHALENAGGSAGRPWGFIKVAGMVLMTAVMIGGTYGVMTMFEKEIWQS